jgi:hypothetical protein
MPVAPATHTPQQHFWVGALSSCPGHTESWCSTVMQSMCCRSLPANFTGKIGGLAVVMNNKNYKV